MSTSEPLPTFAATQALVRAARGIRWDDIPEDAREVARHCLLDFVGCAVAGSREPLSTILLNEIAKSEASSEAALIGRKQRASRLTAALLNGAAGHALDFDDTHMAMSGHPSVPVVPAVLALAETIGANGRAILEAIVAGIETECRLGVMLGGKHYSIGFHSTGTVGTFGAAAACAHMLRLEEDGWLRAFGLAGTQAAGLKSGFGTMAKPLHAGRAASNGLFSALAAHGGYSANLAILETDQGFAATHAGPPPSKSVIDRYADKFLIRDTLFKYHASCYLTHAPIQAARQIRDEHDIDPRMIDDIEVRVAPGLFGVCTIAAPTTGLEGKFSVRSTTAMALLGEDTSDLATFSDANVAMHTLVALRDRVRVTPVENKSQTRVSVIVKTNGHTYEAEADSGEPAVNLAAQRENLERKFMALASPVLGRPAAETLARTALEAERLSAASELMRLTEA